VPPVPLERHLATINSVLDPTLLSTASGACGRRGEIVLIAPEPRPGIARSKFMLSVMATNAKPKMQRKRKHAKQNTSQLPTNDIAERSSAFGPIGKPGGNAGRPAETPHGRGRGL